MSVEEHSRTSSETHELHFYRFVYADDIADLLTVSSSTFDASLSSLKEIWCIMIVLTFSNYANSTAKLFHSLEVM